MELELKLSEIFLGTSWISSHPTIDKIYRGKSKHNNRLRINKKGTGIEHFKISIRKGQNQWFRCLVDNHKDADVLMDKIKEFGISSSSLFTPKDDTIHVCLDRKEVYEIINKYNKDNKNE
jgi:hypothetical protein